MNDSQTSVVEVCADGSGIKSHGSDKINNQLSVFRILMLADVKHRTKVRQPA